MKKELCNHQFFELLRSEEKSFPENPRLMPVTDCWCTNVMCVLCGEQRKACSDGDLIRLNEEGIWEKVL